MNQFDLKQTADRVLFIDYARSIALFLVVYAHLFSVDSSVKLYIYAFHMPFFFLLSGFFHKRIPLKGLIVKMTRKLLVPFCFFLFIGYLIIYALPSHSFNFAAIKGSIFGIVYGKDILTNDILWFLLALFNVRLMGTVIISAPVIMSVVFVFLFCVFNYFNINYFYLHSSLMALPFYLFGYYGRPAINRLIESRFRVVIIILLLMLTFLLSHINGKVSMMSVVFGRLECSILSMVVFYINGIIGSLMLLCIGASADRKGELRNMVQLVSRCSISIVGFQFVPIMFWIQNVGFNQSYFVSFVFSLGIIVLCVAIHVLLEKYANWLLCGNK